MEPFWSCCELFVVLQSNAEKLDQIKYLCICMY